MSTHHAPQRRPAPPAVRETRSLAARTLQGTVAFAALVALTGGVPWALWRYISWPLPDHIPGWDELRHVLTGPLTTGLLLNTLAILCWLAWATFVVDVLHTLPTAVCAAVRGSPRPAMAVRAAPMHTLAAVLVTTFVFAVLGQRPQPAHSPAAVGDPSAGQDRPAVLVAGHTATAEEATSAPDKSPSTVVVREPRDGVHDALWRIACRELGDGTRWPEIYRLNKGRPQHDGNALVDPDLIYPGWILLLPEPASTTAADTKPDTDADADRGDNPTPTAASQPRSPTPTSTSTPSLSRSPTPTPTASPHQTRGAPMPPDVTDRSNPGPGIDTGTGIFIGLGLAATISTAILVAGRRRRRWYIPGSGDRADLPVAPVVRTLRVAHLHTIDPDEHGQDDTDDDHAAGDSDNAMILDSANAPPAVAPSIAEHPPPTSSVLPVGIRDGHDLALDLARACGLGLVGPGTPSAARALLIGFLASTAPAQILIPEADLADLLDAPAAEQRWPAHLRVVPNVDAALDAVERDIVHRARLASTSTTEPPTASPSPLILIATPHSGVDRRLQAILDNGSTLGIAGILLDQWQPGATAHIRIDGTVSATNPGHAEQLRGARLFTLPAPDANDLLTLLHDAETASAPQPAQTRPDTTSILSDAGDARPRASPPRTQPESDAHHANRDQSSGSSAVLSLNVLGPPQLIWHPDGSSNRDITAALSPRQRELLVFLALHPDGVARDTLADTLWSQGPAERPFSALHTALSRLRRTLQNATDHAMSDIVTVRGGRYQLHPDLIDVDYRHYTHAVAHSRTATTDTDRAAADRQIMAHYHGELATGLQADWIDVPREAARRDAIDAAARLARLLVDDDPQQTLHLLETARGFDPHNELIYRDIMRLQARLGQHDAISRTLALLTTRLAELDEHPDPATVTLSTELQHRHDTHVQQDQHDS